jgi:DNA-binding CsgD family transcriptional regulator
LPQRELSFYICSHVNRSEGVGELADVAQLGAVRFGPARPPGARDAARRAKSEHERRVVEFLSGGLSTAEIAKLEGVTERGMRKYVRNLIARRTPEATGEFIAVQMGRLNEALLVSFDAVNIVRELDRHHGLGGGARAEPKRAATCWKVSIRGPGWRGRNRNGSVIGS